jgi:hypothetical protein
MYLVVIARKHSFTISSNHCRILMLNTEKLLARVQAPSRAKSRSFWVTAASRDWADNLRESGTIQKTTTTLLTDGLLSIVDAVEAAADPGTVLGWLETHSEPVAEFKCARAQFSLPEPVWQKINTWAQRCNMTPSEWVRISCHIAMEQVHNEIAGR